MMERRKPLSRGQKRLQRRTMLKAGDVLKRGGRLRSKARPSAKDVALRDPIVAAKKRAWPGIARAKRCAMCRTDLHLEGHHVLPLEDLIREGVDPMLWWDTRNQLSLCAEPSDRRCHPRHELHVNRVPRSVVLKYAPRALEFADEAGLRWLFDREYPIEDRRAA